VLLTLAVSVVYIPVDTYLLVNAHIAFFFLMLGPLELDAISPLSGTRTEGLFPTIPRIPRGSLHLRTRHVGNATRPLYSLFFQNPPYSTGLLPSMRKRSVLTPPPSLENRQTPVKCTSPSSPPRLMTRFGPASPLWRWNVMVLPATPEGSWSASLLLLLTPPYQLFDRTPLWDNCVKPALSSNLRQEGVPPFFPVAKSESRFSGRQLSL